MKFKSTKKALIASLLMLTLCFSALAGTTFAWFTDSVSSNGNIIQSGTLKIGFDKWDESANDGAGAWTAVNGPIFNYNKWEPGYTQIVNLRVTNLGTLALKWQATIQTEKELSILADVINVYVRSDDQNDSVKDYIATVDRFDFEQKAMDGEFKKFTLRQFVDNLTVMTQGTMVAGQESYLGLVLQMDTAAGNDYQGLDLGGKFDLKILATQHTYEDDSYGNSYDALAPFVGSTVVDAPAAGVSGMDVDVKNEFDEKIGTITIPADAVADPEAKHTINILPSNYVGNFTVEANETARALDINVSNIKADNEEGIKVNLYLGQGLDPATVKVYHYDQLIPSAYNPYDGYVTFETTDFSPFTFVFDADSKFTPPAADPDGKPVAIVVAKPEYVGVDLPWGSYGKWSPTEGLDTNLEVAYQFICGESFEEALENPYAYWECDFVLKLDRALEADQIFLGGNYGSFGWVGFHNDDVVLAANEEVTLLGSVTETPWTYLDVVQYVGTFTCGVGDVGDALSGATFTVMLRLTNPENKNDFFNVKTITYTFE